MKLKAFAIAAALFALPFSAFAQASPGPTPPTKFVAPTLAAPAPMSFAADGQPAPAAKAGFNTETFSSTLARADIDMNGTGASGFKWYLHHFFGTVVTPKTAFQFSSKGQGTTFNGSTPGTLLATAQTSANAAGYVGTAFGGGGYFEAELSFDPARARASKDTGMWPGFWSMTLEHLANLPGQQWSGQAAGFAHFAEMDTFEYDLGPTKPNEFGGALHDWYGIYNTSTNYPQVNNQNGTTKYSNFDIPLPGKAVFTTPHKFGLLWIPATATTPGSATVYLDDQPTKDSVSWTQFTGQAPPPGTAPWTFGIVDQQHLVLFLQTGLNEPMVVLIAKVWQKSAANNLVQ